MRISTSYSDNKQLVGQLHRNLQPQLLITQQVATVVVVHQHSKAMERGPVVATGSKCDLVLLFIHYVGANQICIVFDVIYYAYDVCE